VRGRRGKDIAKDGDNHPPREKCDPNALNPVRQDVQDACGGKAKVASVKCDCAELDTEDGDHCDTTSVAIP
jgi:hypothetical protein